MVLRNPAAERENTLELLLKDKTEVHRSQLKVSLRSLSGFQIAKKRSIEN